MFGESDRRPKIGRVWQDGFPKFEHRSQQIFEIKLWEIGEISAKRMNVHIVPAES